MSTASTTASRWAVSARTRGEVLTAGTSSPALELVLLGVPGGFSAAEIEGWLRDLSGVAIETSREDTRERAIPALLHHALTGLLFSQAELWGRADGGGPCSVAFVDAGEKAALGWVGSARASIHVNGEPHEPRWVIVRDQDGREARATTLPADAEITFALEFWPQGEDGSEAPVAVEASWSTEVVRAGTPPGPAPVASAHAEAPAESAAALPPVDPGSIAAPADPSAAATPQWPAATVLPLQQPGLAPPPHEEVEFSPAADTSAEPDAQGRDQAATGRTDDASALAAAESLTAPRAPHPVARWLGKLLRFGRKEPPNEPRQEDGAPVSAYDALLSERVAPTHLEQTSLELPPLPPPPDLDATPDALPGFAIEDLLPASPADAGTPHAHADRVREMSEVDATTLPTLPTLPRLRSSDTWRPEGGSLRTPGLEIDREPVGADRTFAIPPLPPAPPPRPAPLERASIAPEVGAPPAGPATPVGPVADIPRIERSGPPVLRVHPFADRGAGPPVIVVRGGSRGVDTPPVLRVTPTPEAPPVIVPTPPIAPLSPARTEPPRVVPAASEEAPAAPAAAAPESRPAAAPESRPAAAPAPPAASIAPAAEPAPAPLAFEVASLDAVAAPLPQSPAPLEAAAALPAEVEGAVAEGRDAAGPLGPEAFAPADAEVSASGEAADAPPRARRAWPLPAAEPRARSLPGRPWMWATAVALVFGAGWLLGSFANPTARGEPGPFSRALRALGFVAPHFVASVNSEPNGAWIAVDGKDVARRTPADVEIPPGRHTITLSLPELGSASVDVSGARGGRVAVNPSLDGGLEVVSSDPSTPLSVSLDGRPVGYAPVQLGSVAPGLHELQFTGPGMPAWAQTVQVGVRRTAQVVAHPMSAPADGVVKVQATLNDAQAATPLTGAVVFVDGQQHGVTPVSIDLPRGPHSLRVTWRGETAPVQVIDLPGGNERFATFAFGLDTPSPQLTLLNGVHPASADQPVVVSAAVSGLQQRDVREAWLHVSTPEGLWRRYPMTVMGTPRGPVLASPFPAGAFDTAGSARWYVSASTLQGDEYFSEMQSASVAGAVGARARTRAGR